MPDVEKDGLRTPPDCWPTCEYGVNCPHEWIPTPPTSGDQR